MRRLWNWNSSFIRCLKAARSSKVRAVTLGNDGHDIDKLAQLLEHDNVDGLQSVAGRLDEEQAAVDARVLEVALTLSSQLLA